MSNQRKLRYTVEDLITYLEDKVSSDDFVSDEEYGLYLSYQNFGAEAFRYKEYQSVVATLKKEMKEIWVQ